MPLQSGESSPAAAEEIHCTALVIDTHADTAQRFADEGWDFTAELGDGHLNLETARGGALGAEFFAIWPEPRSSAGRFALRALELIDAVQEQVRRAPAQLRLCVSADDIVAARNEGRFAVLIGIEGGHAIEDSLALLRTYFRLGARYMTLTWANSIAWAGSSGDEGSARGLTDFGREVVREMNRLGMAVDISHVSDATFADVLAIAKAPVLASHSCARALTNAPRNLTDDQLRAVARSRGAVMVNFYAAFIDESWRMAWAADGPEREKAHAALEAEYSQRGLTAPYAAVTALDREFARRVPRPPLGSLIDHIDYVAKVAGIDHVGLGSDFDGISALPEGIDSAADLPKITAALQHRGYGPEELRKILGGNLLRVLREVEAAAREDPERRPWP